MCHRRPVPPPPSQLAQRQRRRSLNEIRAVSASAQTEDGGRDGPRCRGEPLPSDPRGYLTIKKSQTEGRDQYPWPVSTCSNGAAPLRVGFHGAAAVLGDWWSVCVRDEHVHLLQLGLLSPQWSMGRETWPRMRVTSVFVAANPLKQRWGDSLGPLIREARHAGGLTGLGRAH